MRIVLADPADASVNGGWTNPDPIDIEVMRQGAFYATFQHDSTSSDEADVLYDLSAAPGFSGPVTVWGVINDQGMLRLFMSETSGDTSLPFADLQDFAGWMDGSGPTDGWGQLFVPNRLPSAIQWQVSP